MPHFGALLSIEGLISLVSLAALEIVLGIDNIVFIAIVSERVDAARRPLLRRLGVGLALVLRLALLFALSWLMGLTRPLLPPILGHAFSGRDLVLLAGGLFLMGKAAHELFKRSEEGGGGSTAEATRPTGRANFGLVLAQILILDVVFSLD